MRQAIVRPGYDLPPAPDGVRVSVSSRSGGAAWAVVEGAADDVREYLASMPAPAPSTWDGRSARSVIVCWPSVILQPAD